MPATLDYANPKADGAKTPRLLRALSHRNYRLFFTGNGLSLVGTWMTNVATAWMVYTLAGGRDVPQAAVWLGYVAFASQVPAFCLSSFCGVFVDRHDRRRILVVTQILSMLQSAALAVLAFSGIAQPWHVIGLAFVQGLINAMDIPARQSFVVEMVEDRADLSNAIAMNSMMFNSARLVGPAIGGLLINAFGVGACFSIDAVSYAAVIVSLVLMKLRPRVMPAEHPPVLESLREGFRYAFGFAPARSLILFLATASFIGAALPTLLPVVASHFDPTGGARMLGWLSSAVGVGALCSAVYLASRHTVVGLGRVISIAAFTYAVAIFGFAMVPSLWMAVPMLMLVGAAFMCMFAGSNTMLQSMVDDQFRGRLMSFFSMAVMGMTPFGAMASGFLASHTSARVALLGAAAMGVVLGIGFAVSLPNLRKHLRPIYVQKGILPEVAISLNEQATLRAESGSTA